MQLNRQPVEKLAAYGPDVLDVHSIFYTIQGEGPFAGYPAVFVRLAGCNLRCPLCDTEYTEGRRLMNVPAVLAAIEEASPEVDALVVITGGEPLRQNLTGLFDALRQRGFKTQVETNGVLPPLDDVVHQYPSWVISPKTSHIANFWYNKDRFYNGWHIAFKYVLSAKNVAKDGLPTVALGHRADPHVARPPKWLPDVSVFLNPLDEKDQYANADNRAAVVRSSLKFGYRAGLQMHKYLGVE